jgi:hypothetical protein
MPPSPLPARCEVIRLHHPPAVGVEALLPRKAAARLLYSHTPRLRKPPRSNRLQALGLGLGLGLYTIGPSISFEENLLDP